MRQENTLLGAGVLGVDATLEGPFAPGYQGSYLVNYRYSTLAILNTIGIDIVGDALPVFQDLSYNISLPTKKAGNFTLFGLGGISGIEEAYDDYKSVFDVRLGVSGVTHKKLIGKKSVLKSTIAFTGTSNNYHDEELDSLNQFYEDYAQTFKNTAIRGTVSLKTKFNSKHTVQNGIIVSRQGYDMNFSQADEDDVLKRVQLLNSSGTTWMMQAFSAYKYRVNEALNLNGGLHYTYFALNGNQALEPRAGFRWQVNPRHAISGGVGLHFKTGRYQFLHGRTHLG